MILLTNANTFADAIGVDGAIRAGAFLVLAIVAIVSVTSALMIHRRERAVAAQLEAQPAISAL